MVASPVDVGRTGSPRRYISTLAYLGLQRGSGTVEDDPKGLESLDKDEREYTGLEESK